MHKLDDGVKIAHLIKLPGSPLFLKSSQTGLWNTLRISSEVTTDRNLPAVHIN